MTFATSAPPERIRRRTLRFRDTIRRIAGPGSDHVDFCLGNVLGTEGFRPDCALGRSALNSDGTPLQICLTVKAGTDTPGYSLRIIGDPCSNEDGYTRLRHSRAAMTRTLRLHGAGQLIPIAESLLDLCLPQPPHPAPPDGGLWLGVSPNRSGVALYVEAASCDPDLGWQKAQTWVQDVLPNAQAALAHIVALSSHCDPASFGIEGLSPTMGRAKIYFRLKQGMNLADLGIALLCGPEMIDFLKLAMGTLGVDREGLVMSIGFDLRTGALHDAKADLCGHCLTYSAQEWQDVTSACSARFGLPHLDVTSLLSDGDSQVAFLGFGITTGGEPRLNLYLQPPPDAAPTSRETLQASAQDALAYLADIQSADGSWEDYQLPVGPSDQWVTAYVGLSMARAGEILSLPWALAAANRAADWLNSNRPYSAGWGYNGNTGPDADSTAMALTLFRLLQRTVSEADQAFLESRWCDGAGGVATYNGPNAWGTAHWDVTPYAYASLSDAAQARHRDDFLNGLRTNRCTDGTWRSYWWRSPLYCTLITLEALEDLGLGDPGDLPPTIQMRTHGALDLACALGIATHRGVGLPMLAEGISALLRMQTPSGLFPGGANLRVTEDTCYAPWDDPQGHYYADLKGTITTATAARVLSYLAEDARTEASR